MRKVVVVLAVAATLGLSSRERCVPRDRIEGRKKSRSRGGSNRCVDHIATRTATPQRVPPPACAHGLKMKITGWVNGWSSRTSRGQDRAQGRLLQMEPGRGVALVLGQTKRRFDLFSDVLDARC